MNFYSQPSEKLKKILKILKRKDPFLFMKVKNKMFQISLLDKDAIQHFKNLRHGMKEYKRVHVGSFVLTFRIDENKVVFENLEHHDNIYN